MYIECVSTFIPCLGLWGPHEEALPGPEGHAFLCWSLQIHVLWTRPRHGNAHTRIYIYNTHSLTFSSSLVLLSDIFLFLSVFPFHQLSHSSFVSLVTRPAVSTLCPHTLLFSRSLSFYGAVWHSIRMWVIRVRGDIWTEHLDDKSWNLL